jgi:signal transduction histidine kinase/CheY-like chemotaxis protein
MGTFDWDMLRDHLTWTCGSRSGCGFPEQFVGTFEEFAHRIQVVDRPEVEAEIQRCIAASEPFVREFRIIDDIGDEHWLSGRGEFEFDSRGTAVRLRGVVLEVTDRKRAERELVEKEQLLSDSQRIARIGSWRWDRDGRFTCSDETFRTLGVDPNSFVLTAESFAGLLHPNDRALLTGWLNACWTGAPHDPIEVRAILPDGIMRCIGVYGGLKCDAAGQPGHIAGTLQDVTERRRAEAALRESETNLTAAQELAKLGSWELVSEADGASWSAQMFRFFGRSPVLGPPTNAEVLQLIHPDDRAMVEATNERLFREGGSATIVLRTNPECGVDKWLEGVVVARSDESGRTLRLLGTLQDVTDRKTLEGRLRHSQKMEAMGQLAGGIAHDFNNILAAIIGNAEYAQLDLPPAHPSRVSVEEILRAGHRAKDLVERILAFSRPQADQLRPMQLQPVLEEAEHLLRATLPAGIELSFHASPGLPIVRADASQIHQVVLNLVTNAWHALENRPGRIEARLEGLRVDTTLSRQHPELRPGPYVRLSVTDTGKGIDASTLEHIFEPFFTTKPVGQGAGLGLSVVHGIVRGHGGVIFAESQPGHGATFHVFIPAAGEERSVVRVETPALRETRGQGEQILYIDDEEALVFLTVRFLESCGYRVEGFSRAQDALKAFRAKPHGYDAVITDYNMPGMSGMELAQQLLRIRPDALIALTSGYLRPAEIDAAHALGIREVIPKPYLVDELGPLVQRLLAKSSVVERSEHV